jgi:urate oxidase
VPLLSFHQYGKTKVRLTQVLRDGDRREVIELDAAILFEGDFSESYTTADNSKVLPTDTIKNSVYVIARQHPIESIEQFAKDLCAHFLDRVPHLRQVKVTLEQKPWVRIHEHGSAFLLGGKERRVTQLIATREREQIVSGFEGLEILKTGNSSFSGFLKDDLTTLAETRDRLLGTALDAHWTYRLGQIDFNTSYEQLRSILLDTFAAHVSESVQHTLYDMAKAALASCEHIEEVHLIMLNKHRLLADLARFGLDNPNQIFVATDEPSGYIEARVRA